VSWNRGWRALAGVVLLSALSASGGCAAKLNVTAGRPNLGSAAVVCESLSVSQDGGATMGQLSLLVVADCATKPGVDVTVSALEPARKRTLLPRSRVDGVVLEPGKSKVVRTPPFERPQPNTTVEVIVDAECRNGEPVQGIAACVLL
jgi:hypothetical protein